MNPFLLIKKIRRTVRDYGFFIALEKIGSTILKPLYFRRAYCIYRADIFQMDSASVPSNGFRFRFIDPAEDEIIKQIEDMEEWLQGCVKQKLLRHSRCMAALDGNRVAGFNLVSFSAIDIPLVHYRRPLRGHECFSEQITVGLTYRKRGLGSAIRRKVFFELKEMGIKYLYGGTNISNIANLKLSRKVGLREIAIADYRRLLTSERLQIRRFPR